MILLSLFLKEDWLLNQPKGSAASLFENALYSGMQSARNGAAILILRSYSAIKKPARWRVNVNA